MSWSIPTRAAHGGGERLRSNTVAYFSAADQRARLIEIERRERRVHTKETICIRIVVYRLKDGREGRRQIVLEDATGRRLFLSCSSFDDVKIDRRGGNKITGRTEQRIERSRESQTD